MNNPAEKLKRFNYLISEIEAAYHEAARKLELSDSAMLVLYALSAGGGSCLCSELCRASGVSRQTIHSALRKMESEKIIYLTAADKKKKRICLTDAGRRLAARTVDRVIWMENEVFSAWSDCEQAQYVELTEQYLIRFREKVKEL